MKAAAYAKLPTEQSNPRSKNIDRMPVMKILQHMNREDKIVPRAVEKVLPEIARAVQLIVQTLKKGGRLFFVGAGTSGRLGILEAAECPPTFGTPPTLVQAVMAGGRPAVFRSREGAEDRRREARHTVRKKLHSSDVLVAVTASGVTPFVAGALDGAKQKGACTILVACNTRTPLARRADCLIAPHVGPELIAGSTRLKAGTATKLVLNMLTVASMVRLGKVYENWMVDLAPKSRKLMARALALIERLGRVRPGEAKHYFQSARGNVKAAVLMARTHSSYSEAEKKLAQSAGHLRRALSPRR